MKRIISFTILICIITGLLFVGPPGVFAAESPASAGSIPQAANYTAISAGDNFILALKDNGTVAAWGSHIRYGQCTVPAGLSGVKAIAAGYGHSVALKEDGTVVAWGDDVYGHLTVPAGISGVKAIAIGGSHVIALKEDSTISAWGYDFQGQCTAPKGLSGVKAIAAGFNHSVALKEDGTVVAWGDNGSGQCTVPTGLSGVKAIAAGNHHTVALKEDGTVVEWGDNFFGQCTVPTGLSGVKAIAASWQHTVALKEDGTIVAWGDNGVGQCKVPIGLSGVKAITATYYNTVVLKEDGTIISFGYENSIIPSTKASSANAVTPSHAEFNASSPESITVKMYAEGSNKLTGIKNGTNSLTSYDYSISEGAITINKAYLSSCFASSDKLSLTFDFDNGVDPVLSIEKNDGTENPIYKSISSGYNFTLALKKDGTVAEWGNDVPSGLSGIKAVAAGYYHSVALKEDGTVTAWGDNRYEQCNVPAGLSGVKAISAGQYHTVALKEDGTIVAWGDNTYAQCVAPAGLYGVKDIAEGGYFTVALKTDGTVTAWGNNNKGECNVPAGLSSVKSISVGQNHTVALKEDGTVVAWGYNNYGQCNVPSGLSGVKAISAGCYHTVALKEDGTLITWGYNGNGQCSVPAGLSGVKAVSAGYISTAALKDDGTIISFGDHNFIIPITKPLSVNSLNIYNTEFDSLNSSDISVKTYASDKNKLIGVKNGTASLNGSDYSVSGSAVTINSTYLSSYFANASKLSLTFDFDNGNDPVLTIEKNDGGKDSVYKDIKSGNSSTIALKTNGTVAVWGDNIWGECNIPAGLSGVTAIAAGQYDFVALKEDGTVTAWGYCGSMSNVPTGLSGVKAIAEGQSHALALKEDGTVVAWGSNYYGQCTIPSGLSGVKAIAAGENHSVALKEDGTVVAWGYNNYGQCNIPAGLSGVKSIADGYNHIVAIKEDGTVAAWGYNGNGQCNVPSGLSGVKAVAAGNIHTVALKEDGTITAWGDNSDGECTIPAGLSDVKAISAGYNYTSVLKKDGTIIAFGNKNFTIPPSKPLSVNSSVTPPDSTFNLLYPSDVKTSMTLNGNTLVKIMNGASPLTSNDYSISGNTVTISKGFFSYYFGKFNNNCTLTFKFSSGKDAAFTVKPVSEALISPSNTTYDASNPAEIKVTMLSGSTLSSILNEATALTKYDYSVNGNAVTISKSYLGYYFGKFPKYNCNLTFKFSDGKSALLTIAPFIAVTDVSISPDSTTCSVTSPEAIKVTMALNDNTLSSVMNGSAALTKYDYSVSGNVVTINKSYLGYYFGKFPKNNCTLTFKFSSGKDSLLVIKPVAADASVSPSEAVYDVTAPADIPAVITINGNSLKSVTNSVYTLSSGYDYILSGSNMLIKTDYLKNLPLGDTTLSFNFDSGKSSSLRITVKGVLDAAISPSTTTFSVATPESIKVTMTLNGNKLVNIMNGASPLTQYDYSVNGNVVTLSKNFFGYYFGKFPKNNCALTFKFSNGKDAVLTVKPL